jgi:putative polyhydroxyalkanoate system protein
MSDIIIRRSHTLGLERARRIENAWVKNVTQKLDMSCATVTGDDKDVVSFERMGVKGEMEVTSDYIEIRATLNALMAPLKDQISKGVQQQLDVSINKEMNRAEA